MVYVLVFLGAFLLFGDWSPRVWAEGLACSSLAAGSLSRIECERNASRLNARKESGSTILSVENRARERCGPDPGTATWAQRAERERWLGCLTIVEQEGRSQQRQPAVTVKPCR
jgi:hypothetical protein